MNEWMDGMNEWMDGMNGWNNLSRYIAKDRIVDGIISS